MEFTLSEKGQRKIVRYECIYFFQIKVPNGYMSRECTLRRQGHCKAKPKLKELEAFIAFYGVYSEFERIYSSTDQRRSDKN